MVNTLPKLRDFVDEARLQDDALTLISDIGDLRHAVAIISSEEESAETLRLLTFRRDHNEETPAGSARGFCGHSVDMG